MSRTVEHTLGYAWDTRPTLADGNISVARIWLPETKPNLSTTP